MEKTHQARLPALPSLVCGFYPLGHKVAAPPPDVMCMFQLQEREQNGEKKVLCRANNSFPIVPPRKLPLISHKSSLHGGDSSIERV